MKMLASLILALALASCASAPREGWSMKGGELEKGVEFRLSSGADGTALVSIESPYFGEGVEVRGRLTAASADAASVSAGAPSTPIRQVAGLVYEIELTELRYFGNWHRGWTEAEFQASGILSLSYEGDHWVGRIVETPEIGMVKRAKLRYMDSFLRDDQAAEAVQNRMERIGAAIDVWREDCGSWFERPVKQGGLFNREKRKSFSGTVGPVFFPEVYGYSPGSWREGPMVHGDGRSWDTAYTKSRFPEQLWNVRDTGTLYRDWEEGLPLWYLTAQWRTFWTCKFPVGNISILNIDGDTK